MTAPGRHAVSSAQRGWGLAISGLAALLLALDAAMKLLQLPVVLQTTVQIGWSEASVQPLGAVLALATALYVLPRTSVLGAVLLTGYLGGAVATQARLAAPWFSHTLFGVYLGLMVWAGLVLRDARLRALLPWSAAR